MVYRILKWIKIYIDLVLAPIHRVLWKMGLRPIHLSVLSLPCGLLGVWLLFQDSLWGILLVFAYLLFDVLDGSLARVTGSTTEFGARMDYATDRLIAAFFLVMFYRALSQISCA